MTFLPHFTFCEKLRVDTFLLGSGARNTGSESEAGACIDAGTDTGLVEMNDIFSVWQYVVSKKVYDTCSDFLKA